MSELEKQKTVAAATPAVRSAYEAPELVEIGTAVELLQGAVMTQDYYDCPANDGTTRYRPSC